MLETMKEERLLFESEAFAQGLVGVSSWKIKIGVWRHDCAFFFPTSRVEDLLTVTRAEAIFPLTFLIHNKPSTTR